MKEKVTPKISNVFIEIIILILFFSVAAVIIFRIYSISIRQNYESKITSYAIENSQSIIALYKNGADIEKCINKVIKNASIKEIEDNRYVISLNSDFEYEKNGMVSVIILLDKKENKAGIIHTINMKYLYYDEEVYSIEGKKYEEK